MKFTGVTVSLALTGMASAAALPPLIPGAGGLTSGLGGLGGLGGNAGDSDGSNGELQGSNVLDGVLGGSVKRQLKSAGLPDVAGLAGGPSGIIGALGAGSQDPSQGPLGGLLGGIPGLEQSQLETAQPVANGAGSSLDGATGIAGSAAGTAETTSQGAADTAEHTVTGMDPVKRQLESLGLPGTGSLDRTIGGITGGVTGGSTGGILKRQLKSLGLPGTDSLDRTIGGVTGGVTGGIVKRVISPMQPVTDAVGTSLNGATGSIGSAVVTAESTSSGVVGTVESGLANAGPVEKRQFGNLPATTSQTGSDVMAGLSGNPSGLYGALANLQTLVNAGEISPSDISDMPEAVQQVIANLAVA
ncbi:hypothetical protein PDE_04921 [Penicillium oxalicum 114-2]|uniref:Uncharacterized protein n=1 Tax=Penicillium oxalicum (strain 114-2 / CGMCC 5302) TaxID=933388 RepID=S7ZMR1_PENO1|nr:hypothetical protein PDE_04921 [Penicillium oxalicum 114-2]